MHTAVRNGYAELGVKNYYIKHAHDYANPHEKIVHKLLKTAEENNYIGERVLDLCCGSGEVTVELSKYNHRIRGLDPYTGEVYCERTGNPVLNMTFKDIALGKLEETFDAIVCSFALHLCDESMLPTVLWNLKEVSNTLIVISPHKRPDCDNVSGWTLVDEILLDRVRMKVYKA